MIKFQIYPFFKFKSVTFIIILIDITLFFLMILTDTENQILLTPSQSILFEFGELCPTHMKTEFWRFINPIFLHANILHLLSSLITKIYLLSFIEFQIGK